MLSLVNMGQLVTRESENTRNSKRVITGKKAVRNILNFMKVKGITLNI